MIKNSSIKGILPIHVVNNPRATPHKARLTTLHKICLHFSRHPAQKSLDIRQYACEISVQSDEKTDFASFTQALCGIAQDKQGDEKQYIRAGDYCISCQADMMMQK